ncbi:DUF6705 family protein [Winogradskyella undariae]|uniref:DUF6705 family protein n=1 Tax=Winogradskyella undariae TaxID=1285465 RepID=UPI0015C8D2E2|nr:DUF6705 family protein [Winogradskyella undariae]
MKTLIKITLILTILFSCSAFKTASVTYQTNPFVGTWQYQDGNEVFIVTIWMNANENEYFDENSIHGNFKKIIVDANGNEISEVYTSLGYYDAEQTVAYAPAFHSSYNDNSNRIQGGILDRTMPNGKLEGTFSLTLQNNCINCPPNTAIWKVKKDQGLRPLDEPDFNVPTDLILTKIE